MAEYKILEYDYGFFVKNYVGHYQITEFENEKYIVSDEYYNAKDSKKELKTKEIFIDEYKEAQYMVMKLSQININKDSEIIKFCNRYGLPYSSITILDNIDENLRERKLDDYLLEMDHPFFHHDYMKRADFCKYVVNAKNYLILLDELKNKTPDMKKLICSLLYILIFERIWDKNFLEPEEYTNYTLTGQFRYYLQEEKYYDLHSAPIDKILDILSEFCKQTANDSEILRDFSRKVLNLIDKLMLCIEKNGYSIEIDENYDITSENDFVYDQELKQAACKICYQVLADSITEGISKVRQVLYPNNKYESIFKATHEFQYMYEGIYQELFLLCTNGERIHKCQNITCNIFFISNSNRKKFCSHKCATTVAKRKQRMRDKENPNRERLKPGFQSRKRNTNN